MVLTAPPSFLWAPFNGGERSRGCLEASDLRALALGSWLCCRTREPVTIGQPSHEAVAGVGRWRVFSGTSTAVH